MFYIRNHFAIKIKCKQDYKYLKRVKDKCIEENNKIIIIKIKIIIYFSQVNIASTLTGQLIL